MYILQEVVMDFRLTSEQEALRKKKRISRRNMSSRWRQAGRKGAVPS